MSEIILDDNQIERLIRSVKSRRNICCLIFMTCFFIGFILLFNIGIFYGSELAIIVVFILSIVIIVTGVSILYLVGLIAVRVLIYHKIIKNIQINHITINSRFFLSKKNEIYLMFSGFANGIYFIAFEKNRDSSSISKKPRKLPSFLIRLDHKIEIDNLKIKYGEFSGYYKIPRNKREYFAENVKVLFMPLVMFSKTQSTPEYIIKMIEFIEEKTH